MIKHLRNIAIVIMLVGCLRSSGLALTNEEAFFQFQFNFITPGARATALGGAFIGLADDATAVESNPAGLTTLTAPEISVEFKHITYTAEQMYSNIGLEADITRKEFDNVVETVPFLSVVYPYKQFVFSLYRQELVNYKSSYRTSAYPIVIPGTYNPATAIVDFSPPIDASVDLTVTNYGIGVALQLFEGFSVAVSPRWAEMEMKSFSTLFGRETFPGPTDFLDADIASTSKIDGKDVGYSVNVGVLWTPHPKMSIGAVYRSGPEFTVMEAIVERGERGEVIGGTFLDPELAEFTLKTPDSFGAGVAFRATEFLTVTLDVVHIRYEELLDDFDIVSTLAGSSTLPLSSTENYTIDNGTEVHAGVEYIIPFGNRFLALRSGVYNEPDHTIRFTGSTGDPRIDIFQREISPEGEDQIHITGGLGLVVSDSFQVDTAVNIADKSTQLSLSAVYRF